MKLATLCYVRQNDQTLMLHRVKKENDMHEGKWNGLGGKIENGESPEECAIREVREESGLQIKNPRLKGILTFPAFSKNEDWYVFVFVITDFSGSLIDSDEGDLEWIANSDLFSLALWEGDKIFIKWLDSDSFFSAKFNYKNNKLIDHTVKFY